VSGSVSHLAKGSKPGWVRFPLRCHPVPGGYGKRLCGLRGYGRGTPPLRTRDRNRV